MQYTGRDTTGTGVFYAENIPRVIVTYQTPYNENSLRECT
jgi:hypothetical protein